MAKMTDNKKMILIGASGLLLGAAALGGVWWSKGLVDEQQGEIEKMRTEIADAQKKIDKIPSLERDVIVLRECVREYVKILPEEGELNNFVRNANQFMAQSGVQFKKLLPGQNQGPNKDSKFERYAYQIEADGTIWQFMKFMNCFENYERFVNVRNWTLMSGMNSQNVATLGSVEMQHQLSMIVETYVYTGARNSKDVLIPNYANRKQSLREEIYRNIQQVRFDRYDFKDARGRRDIFVDPREVIIAGEQAHSQPMAAQKKLIDDFTLDVAHLRGLLTRSREAGITIIERMDLDRRLKQGLEELQTRIEEVGGKGMISYSPYKLKWTKDVVEQVDAIRTEITKVAESGRDRNLSLQELQDLHNSMKEDLIAGEAEAAKQRFETAQERLEITPQDPRYRTVLAVRGLHVRAQVAIEFAQKKIVIMGVCVNETGRSGMILNGSVVQEGDYVDDDLFVKTVGREQVEFVYKGFTLVKTW